jgi:hypothetical protein
MHNLFSNFPRINLIAKACINMDQQRIKLLNKFPKAFFRLQPAQNCVIPLIQSMRSCLHPQMLNLRFILRGAVKTDLVSPPLT